MRFRIFFKTPDAVECAVEEQLELEGGKRFKDMTPAEQENFRADVRHHKERLSQIFAYGENCVVEIDDKDMKPVVIPVKD